MDSTPGRDINLIIQHPSQFRFKFVWEHNMYGDIVKQEVSVPTCKPE